MSSPRPSPTVPTTVSVTSPADILGYVPHALGFAPVESLVVMTMAGNRLGATLRVDLPAPGPLDPDHAVAFAETVLSFLRGDTAADGVLLALYTLEESTPYDPPPRVALVSALQQVLGAAGLPVRSGWLVSGTTWRDYFCTDERCCPWPGHPLDTVADSRLNAEMVFGGSSFETSAAAAVLRSAPDLAQHGASTSHLDAGEVEEAQAYFAAACAGHWDEFAQFEATSRFWDAVLALQHEADRHSPQIGGRSDAAGHAAGGESDAAVPTALDPESAGFLLASIESRTVRDFLLVSACLGSQAALEGIRAEDVLRSCPGHNGAASGSPGPFVLPSVADAWQVDASTITRTPEISDAPEAPVHEPARAARWARPADARRRSADAPGVLFTEVLAGLHRGPVDWARVDLMTVVLLRLLSVAGTTGEARAAALTMLGWFEYARGRGSRAAVYFDAAEGALPGYRLARLLTELLNRGGLPEWARQRSTAWRTSTASHQSRAA